MKRAFALCSLAIALAPVVGAQNPRPNVAIDDIFGTSRLASDGDLSAFLGRVIDRGGDGKGGGGGAIRMAVATSDGRGIEWTPAVIIDSDPTGSTKLVYGRRATEPPVRVVGDSIYAAWLDSRDGSSELYFNRSTDRGVTWEGDVRLDNGFPVGTEFVRDYTLGVAPDPAGDHLYVFFKVDITITLSRWFLVASHDGGATWGSAVPVSTVEADSLSAAPATLYVDGLDVHTAWTDGRNSPTMLDLFYRKSSDGGATFGPEIQLDSSGPGLGDVDQDLDLIGSGSTIGVVWTEYQLASFILAEVHATVSTDGGASFPPDQLIGGYTPGVHRTDHTLIAASGGNLVLFWTDDRSGTEEVYSVYSSDGGVTWTPEVRISSDDGIRSTGLSLAQGNQGDDLVLLLQDLVSSSDASAEALLSRDNGETWSTELQLNEPTGDIEFVLGSFNALYRNIIVHWELSGGGGKGKGKGKGSETQYMAGFRPQTIELVDFTAGSTEARADMSLFSPDGFVVVGFSNSPGAYTLGGRNTGLALDPLLTLTVQSGMFQTTLDPDGSGSLTILSPGGLSAGTYYGAAIGFDPVTLTFGDITDVTEIVVE
ncbi:MAG: sialidase family protein [Planctomycetota bacterium]